MFRFLPYVLKSLWRHRARTLLTFSGAAVSLFVFCFVAALQEGLDRLNSQSESTLIVFQANKFCPATSHLPQDYDQVISKFEGVQNVVPIQVFTNNCRASLDVLVFYGVPPGKLRSIRDFSLTTGNWTEFENHQDAGIVGAAVAQRRQLQPGDRFSIGEVTITVAGIFTSENKAEENYIYTHLEFLQRTRGLDLVGTVTQHEIVLAPSADSALIADQIDDRFRGGPVETDTRTKGAFQAASLADLFDLISLTHYLGYACLGLMGVLILTTGFMAVQDRIREHAVLQTLGFSGPRVFVLIMIESVLLSFCGGTTGLIGALTVLSYAGIAVSAEAVSLALTPSLSLAVIGLELSIAVGVVAGILPALNAARTEIVPALRAA
ncbi:MAG: ABC transporter permease [Planctomycetota bacterium]|jgi:putative ABC transport system permease protein